MMHYNAMTDRSMMPPHYSAAAAKLHQLQNQNHRSGSGGATASYGLYGSSLVSSTGEPNPSTARQYGSLTRKYPSDGGDELAACLPPDLRHLLSTTTSSAPSQQRHTTTQRLQQHGLLRSTAATAAANSLSTASSLGMYGGGGGSVGGRKQWTSAWSYHDDTGIGYPSAMDRRIGTAGRQTTGLYGTGTSSMLDQQHYRIGARTMAAARSLSGVYDGNSLLYRCSTSNVPDNLERRWYQNQQQRHPGGGGGGARMIRGLGGGNKHMSDMYDDDDYMHRLQQDDGTVSALLLDDGVLGGGYGSRNVDFLPTRPRSRSYGGGEDPTSTTSWRNWPDAGGGSGYLGGALRETAIGSSAAIFDHNGHRRGTAMNSASAEQKRWDARRNNNRRQRRYSDGGGAGDMDPRRPYDYQMQHHLTMMSPMMKYGTAVGGRRSRSWDPSPSPTPSAYLSGDDGGYGDYMMDGYGGGGGGGGGGDYETMAALAAEEEHDEELQREEKKARIKAEIARRRRQIEDNVRLHEELLRLARMRENAEHEYSTSMLPSLSTAGR